MQFFSRKINAVLFLIIIFFPHNLAFAKTESKAKGFAEVKTTYSGEVKNDKTATAIKLPKNRRKSYFSKIDSKIINLVEFGSPASIEEAMQLMHKNESNYKEYEKVLISIATQIMKNVWPSKAITWEEFDFSEITSYTEALKSVDQGIIDTSTGNTDYLSTILPALVVLKSSIVSNEDIEKCKEIILLAISEYPEHKNSVLPNYLLGVVNQKLNNHIEAKNYFKNVYELESNIFENQIAYAKALRCCDLFAEAESVLKTIGVEFQNNVEVLKENAYLSFQQNKIDLAETYVARVLQINPSDLDFVLFRAKILIEKKDYIHAVSLLDMYERQHVDSLEYYILRAKLQLNWSKNTVAALETVEKTLPLYPDNQEILMLAASISAATDSPVAGKYADELASIVLEKDPDNIEALLYQVEGYSYHQNWEKAYEACKKLVSLDSENPVTALRYVEVCLYVQKYNEAYNFISKLYKKNPDDELILQAYVLAYSKTGKRDDVLKFINSLLPETTNKKIKSDLLYQRSFLQKMEENQLADLRSSLMEQPRNSKSLFRLYEIYFEKKDYRKAQYYLKQVVAINPNDMSIKKLNETLTKLIK